MTDVWPDATHLQAPIDVRVVVPLVDAAMLRALPMAGGVPLHRIDRRQRGALVVKVRRTDRHAERDSPAVDRDVPLTAPLGAVRRVRACKSPPFGAFTIAASIEAQSHWMPFFKS